MHRDTRSIDVYCSMYLRRETTALLRGERKQELRAERGPFFRESDAGHKQEA